MAGLKRLLNKRFLMILGGVIILAGAGVGAYYMSKKDKKVEDAKPANYSEVVDKYDYSSTPNDDFINGMTKFIETATDPLERQKAYISLGNAYDAMREYTKANENFQQARTLMDTTGASTDEKVELDKKIALIGYKQDARTKPYVVDKPFGEPE